MFLIRNGLQILGQIRFLSVGTGRLYAVEIGNGEDDLFSDALMSGDAYVGFIVFHELRESACLHIDAVDVDVEFTVFRFDLERKSFAVVNVRIVVRHEQLLHSNVRRAHIGFEAASACARPDKAEPAAAVTGGALSYLLAVPDGEGDPFVCCAVGEMIDEHSH